MKYKVGDKVKLKSKEGLDELKRQVGDLYIHPNAYKNAGSEQTILECNEGFYRYDASSMFWHESLFEGLVEEVLKPMQEFKRNMKMTKNMKVNEIFESIEPMVAQLEKGTALFMIGSEDKKDSGIIRGKAGDIINMLVNQMIRDEHIERIIMVAAQAFIDYAEHQKKKVNDPKVS